MCLLCLCREPCPLTSGQSFTLNERCISSDSIKASSGEVSPYDNNSPVLSDGLLGKYLEDSIPFSDTASRRSWQRQHTFQFQEGSTRASPTLSTDKGKVTSFL